MEEKKRVVSVQPLRIGNLEAPIPVIQGGMGVGISLSGLAGAVAKAGGVGMLSAAQIGFRKKEYDADPLAANLTAVGEEIAKAKEIAAGGIVGINIMVATTDYEQYVKAAVEANVDLIVSGAGLPMNLPGLVAGTNTKIAPIVSGKKAATVIFRQWFRKYNRLPDLVVIEGPLAGGHLGFEKEYLDKLVAGEIPEHQFDQEVKEILSYVREVEAEHQVHIPVVVGGGIFDRQDMERYLAMGADGVQIATRFVATHECDAHERYKQAYVEAKPEDIVLVKSPVGMPGRALHNRFMERVEQGERLMGPCRHCVKTCNPATTPYCISRALINAALGNVEEGLIFCGGHVDRVNRIVSVEEIMREFA